MDREQQEKIAGGILAAMRTEQEGFHFYSMAANSTKDPKAKDVFETLAQEEAEHLRFLKGQRESILKEGRVDANLILGKPAALEGENPIFSDGLCKRIEEAHYEMTALSIGIQLELDSEKFYRKQAQETDSPEVSAFFNKLADWESLHYAALLKQHDNMKESYWTEARFAPF